MYIFLTSFLAHSVHLRDDPAPLLAERLRTLLFGVSTPYVLSRRLWEDQARSRHRNRREVLAKLIYNLNPDAGSSTEKNVTPAKVGMEVVGRIVRVRPWGASVDIGAKKKAFLHVTEMSNEVSDQLLDKFTSGQIVKCRIKQVDPDLRVTCKEDDDFFFSVKHLAVGDEVCGTVTSVTRHGAFIDIGTQNAAVLRASDIIKGWKNDLSQTLQVGDHIAKCYISEIDSRKERVRVVASEKTRIWRPGRKGSLQVRKRRGRWST